MDARCKYRGKKKKKIAEHWLFIVIEVIFMYEKKSHTHTHTHTHLEMQETEDRNLTVMRIYE